MPSKSKATIPQQLNAGQLAVNGTLANTEIKTLVGEYGYTTTKLHKGKNFHTVALTAVNTARSARGVQKAATAALKTARLGAHDAFQALAQIARSSLPQEDLETLGLSKKEPRGTAAFILAGYTLFDN